ncbi:GNAT family N-acetyltransferase [Pseudomonas amygdali]|uniref:GNAT family N-acetyltransferase n=1 Tax=Pseudomonas amygdali TaxID=47877 RepID=UPI0039F5CAC5
MLIKLVDQGEIPSLFKEVLYIAGMCSEDLMKYKVGQYHPFYNLLKNWVVAEVNLHLGFSFQEENFKLAVALNEFGDVVAFATFTASWSHPSACGINYIATLPSFRRQGLMRSLIELIKSKYPDVSLCCDLDLIPYYTKLGFSLKYPEGTQVSLSTANSLAVMPILSEQIILESPPIARIMDGLNKKYGKRLKKIDKAYAEDKKRAETNIVKEFERLVAHLAQT